MAVDEKLLILADEVYQANIWKEGAEFSSFKKVYLHGCVACSLFHRRLMQHLCDVRCVQY